MTIPPVIEEYSSGQVALSIYQFEQPLRNTYWLKAGVGCIEFPEQEFGDLIEVMDRYLQDDILLYGEPRNELSDSYWKGMVTGAFIITASWLLGLILSVFFL